MIRNQLSNEFVHRFGFGLSRSSVRSGIQRSGHLPTETPKNSRGVTPMTVKGIWLMVTDAPMMDGSAPNRLRQKGSLSTTTEAAAPSSSSEKNRPYCGATPSTEKKLEV